MVEQTECRAVGGDGGRRGTLSAVSEVVSSKRRVIVQGLPAPTSGRGTTPRSPPCMSMCSIQRRRRRARARPTPEGRRRDRGEVAFTRGGRFVADARMPRAKPVTGPAVDGTAHAEVVNTMRLAVLSDIHANSDALAAVLADIRRRGIRHIVHLGDLVGYNTRPRETLALVREHGIPGVYGNHDLMAIGRLSVDQCGPIGRKAILWTRRVLSSTDWAYLASLPGRLRPKRGMICLHSALDDPVVRLLKQNHFHEEFLRLQRFDPGLEICFTGHTHVPAAVALDSGGVTSHFGSEVQLTPGVFWFVNPGSVGQPRDGNDRAAYAVFDSRSRWVSFHRVPYIARRSSRVRGLVARLFTAAVGADR